MALTLSITGGTGFVGRHTLAAATAAGHRLRVLARSPQPAMPGVCWIAGDLADGAALSRLVAGADAIVHIAGVTNAADARGFARGNPCGTAHLRRAAGTVPVVVVSSLSARAPWLSLYGASKLAAEQIAIGSAGPVTIVRPPAVYGPGDTEFLALFRAVKSGIVPLPADARASMIFGPDLAAALVALAEDLCGARRAAGRTFEIDDGAGGYGQNEIARTIAAAVGRRIRILPVPGAALRIGAAVDTLLSRPRGLLPKLSFDRARYLAHPDWTADVAPLLALGIWQPRTRLPEGISQTADHYRAAKLL